MGRASRPQAWCIAWGYADVGRTRYGPLSPLPPPEPGGYDGGYDVCVCVRVWVGAQSSSLLASEKGRVPNLHRTHFTPHTEGNRMHSPPDMPVCTADVWAGVRLKRGRRSVLGSRLSSEQDGGKGAWRFYVCLWGPSARMGWQPGQTAETPDQRAKYPSRAIGKSRQHQLMSEDVELRMARRAGPSQGSGQLLLLTRHGPKGELGNAIPGNSRRRL